MPILLALPPASHHDRASLHAPDVIERGLANKGVAGHPLVSRDPSCTSVRPTIPGQGVRPPNRRAVGSSLDFSLTIAPTAEPGAVAG